MLQGEFCLELAKRLKSQGISLDIETAGFVPWTTLERIKPYVDTFLYDLKLMDEAKRRHWLGTDQPLMLDNLQRIASSGADIIIRIPLIPGVNDTDAEFSSLLDFVDGLPGLHEIHILPFHQLGSSKYQMLGMRYDMGNMEEQWTEMVRNLGLTGIAAPDPLFSALLASCREQGEDYYRQGAKYQLWMLLCAGFADTIGSLYTIRELVYVQHRLTLGELVQAMKDNWRGHERLQAYIIHRLPKYGNDAEGPDALAVRFLRDYSAKVKELRSRNKKIVLTGGIGTFHIYAALGNMTGASANGRWAYDALAPNYSPVPGNDQKGPLCVIKSATKADLSELMAGTPIDIAINANEFQGDSGIGRLRDLILDFCDVGGQIMTITSSSVEELRDAQYHPEKHKGLRVRMGGLSAYFIQLAPEQQDKIIARFH